MPGHTFTAVLLPAAFPQRPEECLSKSSRRIWRQDQIKHEYWNQNAREFLQSGKRAWVLKACHWDWQMSVLSDHLPHKDSGRCPVSSLLFVAFVVLPVPSFHFPFVSAVWQACLGAEIVSLRLADIPSV